MDMARRMLAVVLGKVAGTLVADNRMVDDKGCSHMD